MGALSGIAGGGGSGVTAISTGLGALNPVLGILTGLMGGIAKKAYEAQAGFQSLQATLGVALGNVELANKDLAVLEGLAVKLPIGLEEISQAFNSLVNRGFKPAADEIASLSGLAASQNKSFSQLTEAILDAEQGELERLKEFGIQARVQGDKVTVSFKGVTKEFTKGARESASAFAAMAKELGLDKLNDAKMKTLSGRMSNLGDTADRITKTIGKFLVPVFEKLFSLAEGALSGVDKLITGYGLFDDELQKIGKTTDNVTYPALERLFSLFSDASKGGIIEQFTIDLGRDMEVSKNQIARAAAELEYFISIFGNLKKVLTPGNGVSITDFNKLDKASYKQLLDDRKQYERNVASIDQARDDAKNALYKKQVNALLNRKSVNGELEYGADGKPAPKIASKEEIDAAKKELDRLLKLQEQFQDEKLKLEEQYGKERLETLSGDQLKYISEKAKLDKQEIELERQKYLALKQAAYGKKATLSKDENAIFDSRSGFVDDRAATETNKYYKDQAEAENNAQKEITHALSNEYQQQLQDIEYKFEEMKRLAEKYGIDTVKIEKQKQKDLSKVKLEQDLSKLDKEADSNIQATEMDILQAQIDGRVDMELEARTRLLEIEKMYNDERIKILRASGVEGSQERAAQLEKSNKEIEASQKEVTVKFKEFNLSLKGILTSIYGKLFGNVLSKEELGKAVEFSIVAADNIKKNVSELYSTLTQLSENRINRIDSEISKKQEQVDTEAELNKQGSANNLNLRLKELEDLKAARERALKDQQRLQKLQLLSDTASQASSMITAASKVFAGFSSIPIVGVGLGIAAVALMLGSFAAAKIKAFQLTKQAGVDQFKDGGRHTGRLHSEGGELVEVERDEWTINRKSSMKYDSLLNAINQNNESGIQDYLLKDLISSSGPSFSIDRMRQEAEDMREARAFILQHENENLAELKGLREELRAINKSTARIPKKQYVNAGENKIAEITESSMIIRDLGNK